MQLWLNRTGEVSLREQMITQIVLAILCRELAPGDRLPSTRELARRFQIHANTSSRAYRQLERDGWLEFRHGSGVFVRESRASASLAATGPSANDSGLNGQIDQLLTEMLRKASDLRASSAQVRERLHRWLAQAPPSRWLIVEPDSELRQILVFEMQQALRLPVSACAPENFLTQEATAEAMAGSIPVARPSKAESVRKLLPAGTALTTLEIRPVTQALKKYLPQAGEGLIGIASRWPDFLRIAHTMIVAAGVAPESLLIRDAARPGWKRGLDQCFAIICDAAIQQHLPEVRHRIAFRLLDEQSLANLRQIEASISDSSPEATPDPARVRGDTPETVPTSAHAGFRNA
jgi:GntR family transcriptional regulator